MVFVCGWFFFFFFNDTATTEIYTLSLHDALPISICARRRIGVRILFERRGVSQFWILRRSSCFRCHLSLAEIDRKSTRLNSSHANISYAVFCLKKKKKKMFTFSPHSPSLSKTLSS